MFVVLLAGLVPPGLITLKDVILSFIEFFRGVIQLVYESAQQAQGSVIQTILQLSNADRIAMAANCDGWVAIYIYAISKGVQRKSSSPKLVPSLTRTHHMVCTPCKIKGEGHRENT